MPYIPPAAPVAPKVEIQTILVKGGVFPMGSHHFPNAMPTWKEVSDYGLGETLVTVGQRNVVMKMGSDFYDASPANFIYQDTVDFVRRLNAGLQAGQAPYGIPTEAELAFATRGGKPVDVRALMQTEGIKQTHKNLIALAEDKLKGGSRHGLLENFVIGDWPQSAEQALEEGIRIYAVTDSEIKEALRNPELPIRAMWMYATGREGLTKEGVWHGEFRPAPIVKWGKPNDLGFYTMSGNLYMWTADGYDAYAYQKTAQKDPCIKSESEDSDRVLRGGSRWNNDPDELRASYRRGNRPDERSIFIGFRVARSVA